MHTDLPSLDASNLNKEKDYQDAILQPIAFSPLTVPLPSGGDFQMSSNGFQRHWKSLMKGKDKSDY